MGFGWRKGTELEHTPSFLFLELNVWYIQKSMYMHMYMHMKCKEHSKTNSYVPSTQVNEENIPSSLEAPAPLPDAFSPKEPSP